jgi:hypothetical protein
MAKILNLKAPESMELRRMDPAEIERYVENLAGEALERLPEEVRPAGVSAVSLDQTLPAAEWEVWAQWTRACADQRKRIEDYSDPVIDEIELPGVDVISEKVSGRALKSQLRVQERASEQG